MYWYGLTSENTNLSSNESLLLKVHTHICCIFRSYDLSISIYLLLVLVCRLCFHKGDSNSEMLGDIT